MSGRTFPAARRGFHSAELVPLFGYKDEAQLSVEITNMRDNGVLAYWIEKQSGNLRSERMMPHDARSGSYEAEVTLKLAVDPIEVTIIPFAQLGNDWAVDAVARLKATAAAMVEAKSPTA